MISFEGQKSPDLIEKIKSLESPPQVLSDCFSLDEIEQIKDIQKDCFTEPEICSEKLLQKDRSALGKMAHPKEHHFDYLNLLLRQKLGKILEGKFELSFSFHRNFFPYGIHTDSAYDSKEWIYKQGIIPLDIFPSEAEVYTVLFEQKSYHPISYPRDNDTIQALSMAEKSAVLGLGRHGNIAQETLLDYWTLSKVDQMWLEGFQIALAFQWQIGNMAIWDRSHLHCSSDFKGHGVDGKIGLMWVSKRI